MTLLRRFREKGRRLRATQFLANAGQGMAQARSPESVSVEYVRSSRDGKALVLTGSRWRVGTSPDCEISFDMTRDDGVSGYHAEMTLEEGRFFVAPGRQALTWLNGTRVTKKHVLKDGDELSFGFLGGPGLRVRLPEPRAAAAGSRPVVVVRVANGTLVHGPQRVDHTVSIGRADHCDIQFDDARVSSTHAEIAWEAGAWWIKDLQSTNGTYVDGMRVDRVRLADHARVELGEAGPALHVEVEESRRTMDVAENIVPSSLTQIAHRYFGEGGAAGKQTMLIRQAYQKVQKKQKKRYWWVIGVIAGLLLVTAGALLYQSYRVKKLEQMHALAEDMFYAMKGLELQIAAIQSAVDKHGDARLQKQVAEKLAEQRKMLLNYNDFAAEAGISASKLSEEDWLIYKVARIFGECDVGMPADFVKKVKEYIRRWQSTSKYEQAIERARASGYAQVIAREMLANNLPPQFFYLALQESQFDVNACGPSTYAGYAKGMWQFIPKTALEYGLQLGPLVELRRPDPRDDRHSFEKSTRAAARYIRFLYETDAQASGLLVMSCYNWGEPKVLPLLRRMPENPRDRNFWKLVAKHKIPEQTYDYVFHIVAAAVIGENPRTFGFNFDNPLAGVGESAP